VARWLCLGALVAGALDISYAIVFHHFRSGVPPARILQSVASGLLGRDAYKGGALTAMLGLGLHFFNAFVITAIFFAAAAKIPALIRRPTPIGILYGIVVYAVMNDVVVPLSAIGHRFPFVPIVAITGILVHMFFIGVPIAWAARAAFARGAG
jgi:hypothetical protein